ncbi:MAG TPA: MBL fold metallo-hydrolase [Janthinobacterium sp.]|nr:MBL fold metallo-hydrolase [Janthinobacterium sp.]
MAQGQVPASAPGIELQGAASYAFSVGDIRFFALSDGSVPQDLHDLLRDTSNKQTDALLHAALLANPVEASINAFLFKLDGRVVLVDTGSGQMFPAGYGGKLLGSLAAAGVTPEQVSDILLTHAHDDHIGGLVRDGHPVFPNATIHIGKPDIDFFLDRSNAAKAHYDMKYFDEANTALKPYIDAGKVQTFSGSGAIMTGVTATVHPGHTPGSAFYEVESAGQKIVFVGDIVHVAAVQFPEPNITITYDVDRAKAAQVREKTFAAFAQDRTLIAVPHMSFPGIGHIRAVGQGYEWLPVAYGNRQIK